MEGFVKQAQSKSGTHRCFQGFRVDRPSIFPKVRPSQKVGREPWTAVGTVLDRNLSILCREEPLVRKPGKDTVWYPCVKAAASKLLSGCRWYI